MNLFGPISQALATNIAQQRRPPRRMLPPASEPQPGTLATNWDTVLGPDEEDLFRRWKAIYAPEDSGIDYDLRGAYAAGLQPDPISGHWPDTYKKPNHPTFSLESQYARYYPQLAGGWFGEDYIPMGLM